MEGSTGGVWGEWSRVKGVRIDGDDRLIHLPRTHVKKPHSLIQAAILLYMTTMLDSYEHTLTSPTLDLRYVLEHLILFIPSPPSLIPRQATVPHPSHHTTDDSESPYDARCATSRRIEQPGQASTAYPPSLSANSV